MTIEEIEMSLPNGLHDAILRRLTIDYGKLHAKLDIEVNIGDNISEEQSQQYKLGYLTLDKFLFCIIESPSSIYHAKENNGVWITSSGPVLDPGILEKLPRPLPKGAFVHYLFINDWNAFIYISAMEAYFEWAM
mgnify:CR=1 FL=1